MKKITEPEEILIRFKDNKVSGAHYKENYKILDDDGSILSEYFGDPQPIPNNLSEELLGIATSAALSSLEARDERIKELEESNLKTLEDKNKEIEDLKTAHADELTSKSSELSISNSKVDELQKEIEILNAKIVELTPVVEDAPDVISELNTAFKTAIPLEIQGQFAIPYAIVRVLVQAGEIDLAKAVISNIEVPEELISAKQSLIDILS